MCKSYAVSILLVYLLLEMSGKVTKNVNCELRDLWFKSTMNLLDGFRQATVFQFLLSSAVWGNSSLTDNVCLNYGVIADQWLIQDISIYFSMSKMNAVNWILLKKLSNLVQVNNIFHKK